MCYQMGQFFLELHEDPKMSFAPDCSDSAFEIKVAARFVLVVLVVVVVGGVVVGGVVVVVVVVVVVFVVVVAERIARE